MNGGTDVGDRLAHHLLYAEYAQKGVRENLFVELLDVYIGPVIGLYKEVPEFDRYVFGYVVEFHFHLIGDETALQIDYAHVKEGTAGAELAQVNEVLAAALVKYHVAYVKVAVNGGIGIGQVTYISDYAATLIVGKERIFFYVFSVLVLDGGEQTCRGYGGVQFLAKLGKLYGILLYKLRMVTEGAGVRELAVNALVQDAQTAVGGAYLFSGLGAGQSYPVYLACTFILIKSHLLQLCGVELEKDVGIILLNVTLTKLSASGEFIVL